jgi:hypothetical protein
MNEFQRKVILSKINDIDFNNEDDKLLKIIENSFLKIESGEKIRILFNPTKIDKGDYTDDRLYLGWNWVRYEEWIDCSWISPLNKRFVGRLDKDKLIELLKYGMP